jgi:hypothetical protein
VNLIDVFQLAGLENEGFNLLWNRRPSKLFRVKWSNIKNIVLIINILLYHVSLIFVAF